MHQFQFQFQFQLQSISSQELELLHPLLNPFIDICCSNKNDLDQKRIVYERICLFIHSASVFLDYLPVNNIIQIESLISIRHYKKDKKENWFLEQQIKSE